MATTGFDTLKVSQDLKAAGFNESQAGAIVRSMAGAFQEMSATKSDIDKLRVSTTSEFATVRVEIDKLRAFTESEFATVRVEIDKLGASTTADIAGLRASTTADIAGLRASTTADIANLKAEVFRALWIQGAGIVGIHLAIGGLLFAAIRFLN